MRASSVWCTIAGLAECDEPDSMNTNEPQRDVPKANQARTPRRRRVAWWWIAATIALFALNYSVGSRATQQAARVRVPYSPFFLEQINAANVAEITSKGTTIQGVFKRAERYHGSRPTTRFQTEIPEFADTRTLAHSLQKAGVTVNAEPLQTSRPWWQN